MMPLTLCCHTASAFVPFDATDGWKICPVMVS
jgi:hypothetical protein